MVWALNELDLEYTLVQLDPFKGETLTPEFLKLSPEHKLPVLCHNGAVFTESLAIIEYLAGLRPEVGLLPSNAIDLYALRHAVSYGMSEIEPYLWIADQCTRLKSIYSWPAGTLEEALERVEKRLEHVNLLLGEREFLVGSQISMADIYIHHLLSWTRNYGMNLPDSTLAYLRRLAKRTAFPVRLKKA